MKVVAIQPRLTKMRVRASNNPWIFWKYFTIYDPHLFSIIKRFNPRWYESFANSDLLERLVPIINGLII